MLETDLLVFVRKLKELGTRYMVTGSWASAYYGKPRMTYDVDIVVRLESPQIATLQQIFPPPDFYCPPLDVIQREMQRAKGQFNIVHPASGTKADLYVGKHDALDAWAFEKTRQLDIEGETVVVAPPEYVILRKLEFFREGGSAKHIQDIQFMLRLSSGEIDLPELEKRIRDLGLQVAWATVQSSPPPD